MDYIDYHSAKILRELSHEKLIYPVHQQGQSFSIEIGNFEYHFQDQDCQLEHLDIDASSIEKFNHGQLQSLDAIQLIIDLYPLLGISEKMLPIYLGEGNDRYLAQQSIFQ
ncbi:MULTISPECIES: hypothetical protein [Xenorhabdus]|uniref:hypothetical protein n=1 Tax=Xenorhabdus TaxID=626 RepID=UPI0006485E84|nr:MULTISPECIES: hypothetical protein [Xenorhabdus]MBC8944333.1 desferrioxamine siderophore biosynthesis protein dfoC [Xenorhabdus indica]